MSLFTMIQTVSQEGRKVVRGLGPDGQVLFESCPPVADVVMPALTEPETGGPLKITHAFDGPILFQFYWDGKSVMASSTSFEAFEQTWCGSERFGVLFDQLATEEQKAIYETPLPKGTFRVWQVAHSSLACGSRYGLNAVHLLDVVTKGEDGAWKHAPQVRWISLEEANRVLGEVGEAVITYDAQHLTPLMRVRSPAFAWRQGVLNEDVNLIRRLFRLTHDAQCELGLVRKDDSLTALLGKGGSTVFAPFAEQAWTPLDLARVALGNAVHLERMKEVDRVLPIVAQAKAQFAAYLLGQLSTPQKMLGSLADKVGLPVRQLTGSFVSCKLPNVKLQHRLDILLPFIRQSGANYSTLSSVLYVARNEYYTSLWAFAEMFDQGFAWLA